MYVPSVQCIPNVNKLPQCKFLCFFIPNVSSQEYYFPVEFMVKICECCWNMGVLWYCINICCVGILISSDWWKGAGVNCVGMGDLFTFTNLGFLHFTSWHLIFLYILHYKSCAKYLVTNLQVYTCLHTCVVWFWC